MPESFLHRWLRQADIDESHLQGADHELSAQVIAAAARGVVGPEGIEPLLSVVS